MINVSLGTNLGPHDGTNLVEQAIDSLVRTKPGRAVVIAASNFFTDNIHSSGNVQPQSSLDIGWELTGNPRTDNKMEIWYDEMALSIELLDSSGKSLGEIDPGEVGWERDNNGIPYIFIYNRLNDPNNGKNVIATYIKGNEGIWTIRLKNTGLKSVSFNAWIERNDAGQSRFTPASDNSNTLGSIACGYESIVVGSYDAHRYNLPLSWFSSSGPTSDTRSKPELSAPGHDVLAASALSRNGVVSKSGTSMAAPVVTGGIAVFLGEAAALGKAVNIKEIRNALINSCRKNPPAENWHARYGFGRFSLPNLLKEVNGFNSTPNIESSVSLKAGSRPINI